MTKNQFKEYAKHNFSAECHYSGKTKTMYVSHISAESLGVLNLLKVKFTIKAQ